MKSTPELIKGELYHLMTHLVFPTDIEGIQDRYGSMKEIYAVIDGKLQLVWERDEE